MSGIIAVNKCPPEMQCGCGFYRDATVTEVKSEFITRLKSWMEEEFPIPNTTVGLMAIERACARILMELVGTKRTRDIHVVVSTLEDGQTARVQVLERPEGTR